MPYLDARVLFTNHPYTVVLDKSLFQQVDGELYTLAIPSSGIPASLATAAHQIPLSTGASAWAAQQLSTDVLAIIQAANAAAVKAALSLTKADVGLGNVDNTSDATKNVLYAATAGSAPPSGTASGDLTGSYPNPSLAAIGLGGSAGDGENIPVVTYDTKGRVTGLSTTPVLGSRVYVVNKQGAAITKGQAVYVYSGGSQKLFVKLAKADSEATSHGILGLVSDASIADNASGYVRVLGTQDGLDTSLLDEGAPVYLSATTAGALTSTAPTAPNHSTYIGMCTAQHGVQGVIYVSPNAGYELGELHDVSTSTAVAYQVLMRNAGNTLWENHTLVKGDVGLGNVDNTSDATKSVLYAATAGSAPTAAHAASHASAGSDPVTLTQSQVTNLTTDLAAKVPLSAYTAADKYLYSTAASTVTVGSILSGWRNWLATTKAAWDETNGWLGLGASPPSAPLDIRTVVSYRNTNVSQLQVATAPGLLQENGALGAADATILTTYLGKFSIYKRNAVGNFDAADLVWDVDSSGNVVVEKGDETVGLVKLARIGKIGVGTTSPQAQLDVRGATTYRNTGVTQLQVGTAPALMQENGALGANDVFVLSTYSGKALFYKANRAGNLAASDLKLTLDSSGRVQIGGSAGLDYAVATTALLQLAAGTATAGTAPLKFTSGTLNTAAEAGAVEFDGTSFFGSTSFRSAFVRGVHVSASLTPTVVAANSASVQTYTVSGLVVPHAVTVSPPSINSGLGIMWARCSASDTLEICWRNFTGGDLTPASGTYRVAGVRV